MYRFFKIRKFSFLLAEVALLSSHLKHALFAADTIAADFTLASF